MTTTAPPVTWADGAGLWHASVPLHVNREHEQAVAWHAILAELLPREQKAGESLEDTRRRLTRSLRLVRERVTAHGTVVYVEEDRS
jgi:hypothetical protein